MIRYPQQAIPEYSAALYAIAGKSFPSYKALIGECFFKIAGLPVNDSLRKIAYNYLGQLIKGKKISIFSERSCYAFRTCSQPDEKNILQVYEMWSYERTLLS